MYARVFSAKFPLEGLEELVNRVVEVNVPKQLSEQGSLGGLMMVNRETGEAMAVGLYETLEDIHRSAEDFNARNPVGEETRLGSSLTIYEVFNASAMDAR